MNISSNIRWVNHKSFSRSVRWIVVGKGKGKRDLVNRMATWPVKKGLVGKVIVS